MSAEDRQAPREVDCDRYCMHISSLLADNRQHMQKFGSDIRRQLIQRRIQYAFSCDRVVETKLA